MNAPGLINMLLTGGVWTVVGVLIFALSRAWPALKKLQIESDASLRGDLMKMLAEARKETADARSETAAARSEVASARSEVADLRTKVADERERSADERRECDRKIAAMQKLIDGLQRQIAQDSQSTASVLGDVSRLGGYRKVKDVE